MFEGEAGGSAPLEYTRSMSPTLHTKDPGTGAAVIHSPRAFFTCAWQVQQKILNPETPNLHRAPCPCRPLISSRPLHG